MYCIMQEVCYIYRDHHQTQICQLDYIFIVPFGVLEILFAAMSCHLCDIDYLCKCVLNYTFSANGGKKSLGVQAVYVLTGLLYIILAFQLSANI